MPKTEVAPTATHTPGEWKVGGGRAINAKAFDGSWKWIADKIRGGSPGEAEANARLIAAAPAMLAALKAVEIALSCEDGIVSEICMECGEHDYLLDKFYPTCDTLLVVNQTRLISG